MSSGRRRAKILLTNTETIAGYKIVEIRGLVQGNTVRAKHMGRDIAASFKNIVGGELKGYTELLTESRRQALERMMAQARQLRANAVVNVRFTTSAVTSGAAELYAYGTAVIVKKMRAPQESPSKESPSKEFLSVDETRTPPPARTRPQTRPVDDRYEDDDDFEDDADYDDEY